jgi:hypothetical protein
MTQTLTAITLCALALTTMPAAADMRLVLDDDTRMWVQAPAPSGIDLILDDETRIITAASNVEVSRTVSGFAGDCSQIELGLGLHGAECGVVSNADLSRMIIDKHD